MSTLLEGRSSTCFLPRFSALYIVFCTQPSQGPQGRHGEARSPTERTRPGLSTEMPVLSTPGCAVRSCAARPPLTPYADSRRQSNLRLRRCTTATSATHCRRCAAACWRMMEFASVRALAAAAPKLAGMPGRCKGRLAFAAHPAHQRIGQDRDADHRADSLWSCSRPKRDRVRQWAPQYATQYVSSRGRQPRLQCNLSWRIGALGSPPPSMQAH
jgi:hypothetical protein